ncbi:MAG TPA: DUF4382 domain-containing protein [Terracidiphilus sp.]|nr:DUF4382 domain-containing protein [Terracidiphilus sp.]
MLTISLIVAACGGGSSVTTTSSSMATVTTVLTDPATCEAPSGPFSHVYVTITDVQANVSSTAGANDSGWVDLTPKLSKSPQQIDLLGQANNQCFLATLGDAEQLQAGNYQQIRVILAGNSTTVGNNACSGSANCVVLASDGSVHQLQLSSESQTGIKIPSGQISNGGFNIAAGQTENLDIDFSTCESIVQEGNGKYSLKPVLHAGEISTTSTSINGKILDNTTGNPVNGTVMVAVEQKDAAGIDRVERATLAGSDGTFVFCPLPSGTYDVVVVGERSDGAFYQPSIVTGVSVGSTVGNVNLYAPVAAAGSAAAFNGMVTAENSSNAGTVADVEVSMLETIGMSTYTIPLTPNTAQSSATASVETGPTSSTLTCPTGTDCVDYSLQAPFGAPYVGAWTSGGTTLTLAATSAIYVVDGNAFVPSSGGSTDCNPTEMKSSAYTLTPGGPTTQAVATLAFTQCQ